jgi:uncharacterized repeat protein (TIGR01451 family)
MNRFSKILTVVPLFILTMLAATGQLALARTLIETNPADWPSTSPRYIQTAPTVTDLSVAKVASPNPVDLGATLTYLITVTNHGSSKAFNVSLIDTLPAGVTLGPVTTSRGSCSGTSTITCDLTNLPATSVTAITIIVTPTQLGLISNTAVVSSVDVVDPVPGNNSRTVTTMVANYIIYLPLVLK